MKRSSSLANSKVVDIGFISFSISFGGFCFGNGQMYADFNFVCMEPSCIGPLKIGVTEGTNIGEGRSFSIQVCISSSSAAFAGFYTG